MTPDPAHERDAVTELVHGDIAAAEARAAAVSDPWYRAQALAWVARHAPDPDVARVARQSLQAAADCADPFQQAAAAAWVVRALLERGRQDEALTMLELALHAVPRIARGSSRAEALFLLFQAAFTSGEDVRRGLLFALAEVYDAERHWRVERNYHMALRMMKVVDPEFARRMGEGGDDERRPRRARALAEEGCEPRVFFW